MISLKLCRNFLIRFLVALVIISSLPGSPAYSQESEDSQIFISGFNAYQQKDYATTITSMNRVLETYPDSPLRDMVLFWLSRAHFKKGNQLDAARYMSQFSKEFPDNPLKGTVDEELLALTARYDRGELQGTAQPVVAAADLRARQEQERAAALKAEADRQAALKAEQERQAAERAAIAKRAADEAERARLAALRQEQERAAALKVEADRQAALKAEQERQAAERVAAERVAAERAAAERRAAEEAERARLAALRQEQERVAALKVEADRQAALKAEQERQAAERAAAAKRAADEAERARLAALPKPAADSRPAVAAPAPVVVSAPVDTADVAVQQAEMVRLALAKAEQKRLAAARLEEEREARDRAAKAELRRVAAARAEQERLAAEAEERRLAPARAEAERVAAEKAERLRLEREKLEQERKAVADAALQKEQERRAALERQAQEKAARERRAAEEAEQKRQLALKLEQERRELQRAEQERQAAAAAESARQAAARKAAEQRPARERAATEKAGTARAALREKAIAQYKSTIERYPSSKAAATAAAKLKELGVSVALPQAAPVAEPPAENSQVLRVEVAQFAGLEFTLASRPQASGVSQRISVPFEITNRGNGSDSFYLESGFPAEYAAAFAEASRPELAVNQTSALAPGEAFKGVLTLVIPPASIDGLRISYPVKAASRLLPDATQSREVSLTAAAPLLRTIVKTERTQPAPGEKTLYRVTVLNVGSTAARGVTLRLSYPPQLEPVDHAAAGFRQEMKAALVLDGLQLNSGERREFPLTFQLKEDTPAGQELLIRAELFDTLLKTSSVSVSNTAGVQAQHGVLVRAASDRQVVIPGQTFYVPLVVTNTGNIREKFRFSQTVTGARDVIVFQDLNRDGLRQATEPVITEVGPLAPKEEAVVVMEISTPRSAADGAPGTAGIVFSAEGEPARTAAADTRFVYARPVLQMAMSAREGRLKPGEVGSFDLTITNRGSNLARVVQLQGAWPEQLELIAAEPVGSPLRNGTIAWSFSELGAGEKRTIKVSYRVKPGTGVGTNIQLKNLLSYEDQLGNRY